MISVNFQNNDLYEGCLAKALGTLPWQILEAGITSNPPPQKGSRRFGCWSRVSREVAVLVLVLVCTWAAERLKAKVARAKSLGKRKLNQSVLRMKSPFQNIIAIFPGYFSKQTTWGSKIAVSQTEMVVSNPGTSIPDPETTASGTETVENSEMAMRICDYYSNFMHIETATSTPIL